MNKPHEHLSWPVPGREGFPLPGAERHLPPCLWRVLPIETPRPY